jgi:hypothetical protein
VTHLFISEVVEDTPMDDVRVGARRDRAERAFERQEEGAKAMSDYEAEALAVRAKTARLRAQRLAKAAQDKLEAGAKRHTATPTEIDRHGGPPPAEKAIAKAAEMAGEQLDHLGDRSATHDQRASRKRRLLKGPKEFRDMRSDLPKRKC